MSKPVELILHRAGFGGMLVTGFHFERGGELVELSDALKHGFVVNPADAQQVIAILGNFTQAVACVTGPLKGRD